MLSSGKGFCLGGNKRKLKEKTSEHLTLNISSGFLLLFLGFYFFLLRRFLLFFFLWFLIGWFGFWAISLVFFGTFHLFGKRRRIKIFRMIENSCRLMPVHGILLIQENLFEPPKAATSASFSALEICFLHSAYSTTDRCDTTKYVPFYTNAHASLLSLSARLKGFSVFHAFLEQNVY